MQLKDAEVGDIVNFTYRQPYSGGAKRFLAKVVSARTLTQEDIDRIRSRSDYRKEDHAFERSSTLVTCTLPGGDTRNFYAERTTDCHAPTMGETMFRIQDAIMRCIRWRP